MKKRPLPKSHVFRGKKYLVKPLNAKQKRDCDGLADAPSVKQKTISLNTDLHGRRALTVALDEAIHACVWDLDNDSVADIADSIAGFLWKLGYRAVEE